MMDRDTLAAFVDGALSPEESARVVLHLADHPEDAAHVDALMELNALLGEAYAAPLLQPAPEPIVATILGQASAVRPGSRTGRLREGGRGGWRSVPALRGRLGIAAALAASVALLVGFALAPGRGGHPVQILGAPPDVDADLRAALEAAPSGPVETEGPHQITLIATFHDRQGRPCREYELLDPSAGALTQGVACRAEGGDWSTEVAVASRLDAGAERDAFVPASGAKGDPEALDRALDRLGAGMAMSPGEEGALLDGWR